jgi:hypothetical protein
MAANPDLSSLLLLAWHGMERVMRQTSIIRKVDICNAFLGLGMAYSPAWR